MNWHTLAPADPRVVFRNKVALFLSLEDGHDDWQSDLTASQIKRQHRYLRRAEKIAEMALEDLKIADWQK